MSGPPRSRSKAAPGAPQAIPDRSLDPDVPLPMVAIIALCGVGAFVLSVLTLRRKELAPQLAE